MDNDDFKKWAKKYKWDKRRKVIVEFFRTCFVFSIIVLSAILILAWLGFYAWYFAPYTRKFFFEYCGLYAFPAALHVVPMFGIPLIAILFVRAISNIIKNRSIVRPEHTETYKGVGENFALLQQKMT